ncbi:multicopper oxidase domain-containing protein [Anaeromyxobacter terrae]|uniref:multicopper oxidase domain-containing protein n=1 Tax=Anaeromyxobacter terrae TaxID=2925406 RepID=UPI002436B112|nr:multicopper oxidase domain-containing protein [Anaeromyxobacter sp. SG22]
MKTTRRVERWLRTGAALLAAVWTSAGYGQTQTMLPGSAIPKWKEALPRLAGQGGTINTLLGFVPGTTPAPGQLTLHMCEVKVNALPAGTFAPNVKPATWAWAYIAGPCPDYTKDSTLPLDTYIGPVILAQRGVPTEVTYVNALGDAASTNVLAYKTSTDQTLHWADPLELGCMMTAAMGSWTVNGVGVMYPPQADPCAWNYGGPIAAVAHLHGGEVPAEVDGSPDSWFTSEGAALFGPKYYTKGDVTPGQAVYTYPNVQEGAPLWFHDHTLGATRLNVYAGLAGGYYLLDPEANLAPNLQPVSDVIPLVIQDRMFDTNGQLFFTAGLNGFNPALASPGWALNPEHPYWNPEFVGDVIAVNGKVWPRLDLQAKRYRFLFLNGSNARTYELFLTNPATKVNGPPLWVIGNDGGLLDAPALIDPNAAKPSPTKLVIMPGERYEMIIDFTAYAGQTLFLRNTAKTPYPGGATPNGATVGQILQLRIGAAVADASYDPAKDGALRPPMQRLVAAGAVTPAVKPDLVRQLTLNEVMGMPMAAVNPINGLLTNYPGGPLEILVNNTKWAGAGPMGAARADFVERDDDPLRYSEVPNEGAVEVWEIVNLTADAHPIHLHLVQFQILNRQRFDVGKYSAAYGAAFPTTCTPKDATGYCPGFGPPLTYQPQAFTRTYPVKANVPVVGGNPDVARFLSSAPAPAATQERGWKDTVQAPPGMVTRIMVRWSPTDGQSSTFAFDPSGGGTHNYVWHCHIIDHEDNEMMRPDFVSPAANAIRTFTKGTELTSY